MKFLTAAFLSVLLLCQTNASAEQPANPKYDEVLAKQLGADERGMKVFVMVTLKTGPKDDQITGKEERGRLFKGHFDNMARLADEGKLVLAGPYVEARPLRGLLLFDVDTLEEAEALVKTDPTVKAGIFVYEMSKFYGSAALVQLPEVSKSLSKH